MCIAAPAKVVEINREKESLFADFGGVRQEAKINLLPDVEIGDYVSIHSHSVFGHDVRIGNYSHVGAHCFFGGYSVIEDEVTIYVHSTILDRLVVGKGATVGAGSVVIRKVKPEVTVFGNPAKNINY